MLINKDCKCCQEIIEKRPPALADFRMMAKALLQQESNSLVARNLTGLPHCPRNTEAMKIFAEALERIDEVYGIEKPRLI